MYSAEKPPPRNSVLVRTLYALVISEEEIREPTVPKEQPAADSLRAEEEGAENTTAKRLRLGFYIPFPSPSRAVPFPLALSFSLFLSNQSYNNRRSPMMNYIHKALLLTGWHLCSVHLIPNTVPITGDMVASLTQSP